MELKLTPAEKVDITLTRGDTIYFALTVTDDDDNPYAGFENWRCVMAFTETTESETPIILLDSDNGDIILDPSGLVVFTKQTEDEIGSRRRNVYHYSIKFKQPNALLQTYMYGKAKFIAEAGTPSP